MKQAPTSTWYFTDTKGTFKLANPHHTSFLYFPLVNAAGMMSCVTPGLHGDIKSGQNSFLTRPVSVMDLHESRAARNFWISMEGFPAWSATGQSALQVSQRFAQAAEDEVTLEAGLLWHTIIRKHRSSGLEARITNFVPASDDQVELMKVALTNTGAQPLRLTATAAIPLYGRSADNLRDHRHVTSLLHRIQVHPHGVIVKPTLSFDERGHLKNELSYAGFGVFENGVAPVGFFALQEEFIGEGGTLDWPEAVVRELSPTFQPGDTCEGYEALAGLRFAPIELAPGATCNFVLILAIFGPLVSPEELINRYGSVTQFDAWLAHTQAGWNAQADRIQTQTADPRFDGWLRWVAIQPTLRNLFGNSFLPYHDYGRGGRGWRDLWQDILGLLLLDSGNVDEALLGHFAGVRIDGSNATIIGHKPGEFKADRNNIPRVWMDHGAWPLMTTGMYLDWTGDLDFLLREQTYFSDAFHHRCRQVDATWHPDHGTVLRDAQGQLYRGSVLEHLLVQNLVAFYNVGEHNVLLLEGADWNDALDMARERGESVAFSAFYAGNLAELARLVNLLRERGIQEISLAEELLMLLDTIQAPVDYATPAAKQTRLTAYLDRCAQAFSGRQVRVSLAALSADLQAKADWLSNHLRSREWLNVGDSGWFNGYYDNLGRRVEGEFNGTVQMTLTGQVFQLMTGVATDEQARQISQSVDRYLYAPELHGIRLNTRFQYHTDALGRGFGFAFGHKENGAMFSHMAVMYAYALYKRGLPAQAHRVLDNLYQHCQDFSVSKMYPGVPEYLDPAGRGMYPYLTGSASWYVLTYVTQAFGIHGVLGDLVIAPALRACQFNESGWASVQLPFAGRQFEIVIHNRDHLEPGDYRVERVVHSGQVLDGQPFGNGIKILRHTLQAIPSQGRHRLDVYLENSHSR